MKWFCFLPALFFFGRTGAQELYVYTDPASNIPARSVLGKVSATYAETGMPQSRLAQRYMAEAQAGISKKLMFRAATGFADMHSSGISWESVSVGGKFRFFSNDESHRHFRMAVFALGAYTRSPFEFDEVNLNGDKSGVQLGLVATELWNRFALSGTVSHTQVLHTSRKNKAVASGGGVYQVMNYSLSGGFLLLPVHYSDYRQTNVNLYGELLMQQSLDRGIGYIDFAPALQFIFSSSTKLNLGYRMEVSSGMDRMSGNSFMVSIDRTFFNVIRKGKR